jgi:hypothetical protein
VKQGVKKIVKSTVKNGVKNDVETRGSGCRRSTPLDDGARRALTCLFTMCFSYE